MGISHLKLVYPFQKCSENQKSKISCAIVFLAKSKNPSWVIFLMNSLHYVIGFWFDGKKVPERF